MKALEVFMIMFLTLVICMGFVGILLGRFGFIGVLMIAGGIYCIVRIVNEKNSRDDD
jgi:hypothetical protein